MELADTRDSKSRASNGIRVRFPSRPFYLSSKKMEDFILNFFDGLSNIDFNFVWTLFGIALSAFWIVVLYWVWLDSGERTTKKETRIAYLILVILLFVVGLIIYLLIRPNQTIEEIYWADLERRYLKYETAELGDCPKCGTQLSPGFNYCPNCKYVIKVKCPQCGVEIDKQYKYCPSCGNQMKERVQSFEEELPSKEVMQEQIQASKEEAADVVESKRIRYMVRKGIAESIGDKIVELFKKDVKKDSENTKESNTNQESVQNISHNKTNKKKNKKKSGNRQR